jgi:hypothetical protein
VQKNKKIKKKKHMNDYKNINDLTGTEAGLLINFNVPILKDGIKEVKN